MITNCWAPKHLFFSCRGHSFSRGKYTFSVFKDSLCMVLVETLHILSNYSLLKYVWRMCYDSHSLHDGWLSYLYDTKEVESLVFLVWLFFLRFYFFRAVLDLICFYIYWWLEVWLLSVMYIPFIFNWSCGCNLVCSLLLLLIELCDRLFRCFR